jgi:hypothetical protein
VDGLGSTLIVAQTKGGSLLGGYNPVGWDSRDDYRATPRAFLFCAPGAEEDGAAEPAWQKLAVLGPGDVAISDYACGGPQFGAADLVIGAPTTPVMGGLAGPEIQDPGYMARTAGDLHVVTSQLGSSYEKLPSGSSPFPTDELVELEAYCNAEFCGGRGGFRITSPNQKAKPKDAPSEIPKPGWWPF